MSEDHPFFFPQDFHLTGTKNYRQWARLVEDLLRLHGSWILVNNPPATPSTERSTRTAAEETRKQGAIVRIRINCEDDVKILICTGEDPYAMWETLKLHFKEDDSINAPKLVQEVLSIDRNDYSDISDYTTSLNSKLERLEEIGII
jgi:hypothetical protein